LWLAGVQQHDHYVVAVFDPLKDVTLTRANLTRHSSGRPTEVCQVTEMMIRHLDQFRGYENAYSYSRFRIR
jgi:hypothetical protein